MTSSLLEPDYSIRPHYESLMSPKARPLSWYAGPPADVEAWRAELRQRLREMLTLDKLTPASTPLTQFISEEDVGPYARRRIYFQGEEGVWIPAYLYLPHQGNGRAILSIHGHGTGLDFYMYRYPQRFAKRGFVVLAPEIRDFGHRAIGEPGTMSCAVAYAASAMMGLCLAGVRLWELFRALDLLASQPEVDPERIGVAGLSMGGQFSMLAAALDERVKAAVVSGFLATYGHFMFQGPGCICYTIPGILEICEMPDIAALIAPRALLVEVGSFDPCFEQADVLTAYEWAKAAFEHMGCADRIDLDRFEGPHAFSGAKAFGWMEAWL